MPEAIQPPPSVPLNATPPPAALAAQAHGLARSPLDVATEQAQSGARAAQGVNDPQGINHDGLDAARKRDLVAGNAQRDADTDAAAARNDAPESPADDASKHAIQWRRPRAAETRRAQDWEGLKAGAAKRESELLAQIETLKKGGAAPSSSPDIDALRKEHGEYLDIVKHLAVERDPEFKAKFDVKRNAAINAAKFASGGASDKIEKLLALPTGEFRDEQIESAIKDFSPSTQARIRGSLSVLAQIDVERDVEIASRKATFEQRQASAAFAQRQHEDARHAQLDGAFERTLARWADPEKGMPFMVNAPEELVASARNVFSGKLDADQLAAASLSAAVLPNVLKGWQRAEEERAKLATALGRLMGTQPTDGSVASIIDAASNAGPTPAAPTSPSDPQYFQHFAGSLEAARNADKSRTQW